MLHTISKSIAYYRSHKLEMEQLLNEWLIIITVYYYPGFLRIIVYKIYSLLKNDVEQCLDYHISKIFEWSFCRLYQYNFEWNLYSLWWDKYFVFNVTSLFADGYYLFLRLNIHCEVLLGYCHTFLVFLFQKSHKLQTKVDNG